DRLTPDFGCERCYGEDPHAVFEYRRNGGFRRVKKVYFDHHFDVALSRCGACGQVFVDIFDEIVDWEGGDDAMDVWLVPVAPAEVQAIRHMKDLDLTYLKSLGEGRRHMWWDRPTGGPAHAGWSRRRLVIWTG